MKLDIFSFFFFVLFLSSLASAGLQLDKGSLTFDLAVDERVCEIVRVSSPGFTNPVSARDIWAGSLNEARNFRAYTYTATEHGITISYQQNFPDFSEFADVEICVEGSKPGEYKGALIFTPESDEQINVEIGTWLIVRISENQDDEQNSEQQGSSSSGGGESRQTNPTDKEVEKQDFEPLAANEPNVIKNEEPSEEQTIVTITNEEQSNWNLILTITGTIIIAGATLFFYQRMRKKEQWSNFS